jgi:hypothetical protein
MLEFFFPKCVNVVINEHNPIQFSTYHPFWPSLLEEWESWEPKMVLPDSVPLSSSFTEVVIPKRHCSMEERGCEGKD